MDNRSHTCGACACALRKGGGGGRVCVEPRARRRALPQRLPPGACVGVGGVSVLVIVVVFFIVVAAGGVAVSGWSGSRGAGGVGAGGGGKVAGAETRAGGGGGKTDEREQRRGGDWAGTASRVRGSRPRLGGAMSLPKPDVQYCLGIRNPTLLKHASLKGFSKIFER